MKFASLHDFDIEAFSRAAAKHVRLWFGAKKDADRSASGTQRDISVFQIVYDSFSEVINFRFKLGGVTHRSLVTYDALRALCHRGYARTGARAVHPSRK